MKSVKILFILSVIIVLIATLSLFYRDTVISDTVTVFPNNESEYTATDWKSAPQIVSRSGLSFPASSLLGDPDAVTLTETFFSISEDAETYEIFYDQETGSIMVMLFTNPLHFTRALAEKKLLSVLPNTKEEICTMNIKVITNINVDPRYSGFDLGLSFCEGSVTLK